MLEAGHILISVQIIVVFSSCISVESQQPRLDRVGVTVEVQDFGAQMPIERLSPDAIIAGLGPSDEDFVVPQTEAILFLFKSVERG